jgi:predicted nucleotide-binding protein
MTTPTDGDDWMTAAEAIQFLDLPLDVATSSICRRAHAGLIKARAKLFLSFGKEQTDFDVPREFWWAEGGAALEQNWISGDSETWVKKTEQLMTGRVRREGPEQAFGVTFRRADIEQLKSASKTAASAPAASTTPAQTAPPTVFIGHGGHSSEWLKLEKFLSNRLHLSPVEFNSTSAAGVATTERLMEMLGRADFAFLISTGEDQQATGEFHPRLNVVHEAGLFQGKLGFKKAIILLEAGCERFSNVHGLNDIRFPKGKIEAAFEDVRGVLEREGLI